MQRISADVPPWWAVLSSSCGTLANTGWRLTAAVVFICATQLQAKTPRRDPNLRVPRASHLWGRPLAPYHTGEAFRTRDWGQAEQAQEG